MPLDQMSYTQLLMAAQRAKTKEEAELILKHLEKVSSK